MVVLKACSAVAMKNTDLAPEVHLEANIQRRANLAPSTQAKTPSILRIHAKLAPSTQANLALCIPAKVPTVVSILVVFLATLSSVDVISSVDSDATIDEDIPNQSEVIAQDPYANLRTKVVLQDLTRAEAIPSQSEVIAANPKTDLNLVQTEVALILATAESIILRTEETIAVSVLETDALVTFLTKPGTTTVSSVMNGRTLLNAMSMMKDPSLVQELIMMALQPTFMITALLTSLRATTSIPP